jgi:hypothetical protein
MAVITEFRRLHEELIPVLGTVRAVAPRAAHHLDGIVNVLLLIDRFFHIHMAHEAQSIALF